MSNLGLRMLVGVVGAPAVLMAVAVGGWMFFGFVLLLVLLCVWELCGMVFGDGEGLRKAMALFMSLVLVFGIWYVGYMDMSYRLLFAVMLFCGVGVMCVELFFPHPHFKAIVVYGLSFFYISLSFSTMLLIRFEGGWGDAVFLFLTVWSADVFGYFGGMLLGGRFIGRKFFAVHSPKKTWEGYVAGVVGSFVVGVIAGEFVSGAGAVVGGVFGAVIGIVSPFGDLVESMLKREVGVKDASGIIPGHGGVFDRFDAFCVGAPLFWVMKLLAGLL